MCAKYFTFNFSLCCWESETSGKRDSELEKGREKKKGGTAEKKYEEGKKGGRANQEGNESGGVRGRERAGTVERVRERRWVRRENDKTVNE